MYGRWSHITIYLGEYEMNKTAENLALRTAISFANDTLSDVELLTEKEQLEYFRYLKRLTNEYFKAVLEDS